MAATFHLSCIAAIIFALTSLAYGNNDACLSPNKEAGECLELTDCQYLYEGLMQYPDISDDTANYIVNSICNMTTLTICCPERLQKLRFGDNSEDVLATDAHQLLEPPKCGASLTDRIYGGVQAEMDEFPWMARLTYLTIYNVKDYYCGGALINSRHVLTAAHCIHPDYILGYTLVGVRLGEWNTTSDPDCEELANGQKVCNRPVVDVAIEWAKPHELYLPYLTGEQNDIGVIRLAQAVSYTENVKPICVPNPKEFDKIELAGRVMDVAGWGETEQGGPSEIMLKTGVPVWQLADCNDVYDAVGDVLIETQFCAGGKQTKDTCSGDSGGPLMGEFNVGRGAYFYVAGIVSYGPYPCAVPGVPGVYTDVVDFWDWIAATVAAN